MCSVCMEIYTPILRKKCVCRFCKADTCSKCIERYLLDRHEDAHCMHCRVNYSDAVLHEICTKTYIKNVYFKHRQQVLVNRERANLPGLQDEAMQERKKRKVEEQVEKIIAEISILERERGAQLRIYNNLYTQYYEKLLEKQPVGDIRAEMDKILVVLDKLKEETWFKRDVIIRIRYPDRYGADGEETGGDAAGREGSAAKEEEKKKFIRRCTRDGCQGFLSTAWKCGICEYYSCNKCFKTKTTKQDDLHTCTKEDLETAELIKKDSKPCPNCGEFIMKESGCSQMFCITCKTPWDWNSGKVVTSGPLHNPHYYEWLRRNGGDMQRNPADVPCGGYPNAWELPRMPKGIDRHLSSYFYEFHRICQEIQDVTTRNFRRHIDNTALNTINIKFLLGDFDEAYWGQQLAKHERARKRDNEVQEIFAAFRMAAVELINRIYNYNDGAIRNFSNLPLETAQKLLEDFGVECRELITMINDALKNISITYSYSVPFIDHEGHYYNIKSKNFANEFKKRRAAKKESDTASVMSVSTFESGENIIVEGQGDERGGAAGGEPGGVDTTMINEIVELATTETAMTVVTAAPKRRRPKVADGTTNEQK